MRPVAGCETGTRARPSPIQWSLAGSTHKSALGVKLIVLSSSCVTSTSDLQTGHKRTMGHMTTASETYLDPLCPSFGGCDTRSKTGIQYACIVWTLRPSAQLKLCAHTPPLETEFPSRSSPGWTCQAFGSRPRPSCGLPDVEGILNTR